MTAFRDGDNVVTTMMEHNSNFVPWYAMCQEILPRFGAGWTAAWPASIRRAASSTSITWRP